MEDSVKTEEHFFYVAGRCVRNIPETACSESVVWLFRCLISVENPLAVSYRERRFFSVWRRSGEERLYIKSLSCEKKYFFRVVKKFPQEIENTREIIENMSEIIQNISDIFFAIYTPADFQVLDE